MEGLGTGEYTLKFKTCFQSVSIVCVSLDNLTLLRFCCRHHCHLPLGGLQSPGAARAGPVRHHLSLPCIFLQSSEDYRTRPCTSNHLPQAPCPSFKWNYSKQTRTTCNKKKKWKQKKIYKKKNKTKLSVLFHWTSSSESAGHTNSCCV